MQPTGKDGALLEAVLSLLHHRLEAANLPLGRLQLKELPIAVATHRPQFVEQLLLPLDEVDNLLPERERCPVGSALLPTQHAIKSQGEG